MFRISFKTKKSWTNIINQTMAIFYREIFVDATRAMSVVTGEKDNKQVDFTGFENGETGLESSRL